MIQLRKQLNSKIVTCFCGICHSFQCYTLFLPIYYTFCFVNCAILAFSNFFHHFGWYILLILFHKDWLANRKHYLIFIINYIQTMKNMTTLVNKSKYIIICQQCGFFLNHHQLEECVYDKNLFKIQWYCQCCKTMNTQETDEFFKTYAPSTNLLVDETTNREEYVRLYIEVSPQMKQNYTYFNRNSIKNKNNPVYKRQMMEESPLLNAYFQSIACQMRLKAGRYFNWDNFLKKRKLSKIQYALWFADTIKRNVRNLIIHYFVLKHSQINEPQIFSDLYWSKVSSLSQYSIPSQFPQTKYCTLTDITLDVVSKNLTLILSSSPLYQLSQDLFPNIARNNSKLKIIPTNPHIFIINLQEQIDPITLQPTTTSHYLKQQINLYTTLHPNTNHKKFDPNGSIKQQSNNILNGIYGGEKWHKNWPQIQILDHRIIENKTQKEFISFVIQIIKTFNNEINVYTRKIANAGQGQINMLKGWQKIIDKNQYKNYIYAKYKENVSSNNKLRLFSNEKNKIYQILSEFNGFINRSINIGGTDKQSIEEFIHNILSCVGKNYDVRIFMKINSYQNEADVTKSILWYTSKNEANNTNKWKEGGKTYLYLSIDQEGQKYETNNQSNLTKQSSLPNNQQQYIYI